MVNNSAKNSRQMEDVCFNEFIMNGNPKYSSRRYASRSSILGTNLFYLAFATLGAELQLKSSLSTSSKDITIRYDPTDDQEQQHTAPGGVFDYLRYTLAQVHHARATICPLQTLVLANKSRSNPQPIFTHRTLPGI